MEYDRQRYQEDGYLPVKALLTPDNAKALLDDAADLFDRPIQDDVLLDTPVIWVWRHRPDGRRSIFPLETSAVLHGLVTGGELHNACRELANTDYLQLFECVLFDKPPSVGEQFAWHNDRSYYPTDPGNSISVWIALDKCDEENGAIQFAKGSIRHGVVNPVNVKTGEPVGGDAASSEMPDPVKAGYQTELLEMNPGDGVFFDANAWHASPPNRSSTRHRRAMCVRFWTEPVRFSPAPNKQSMFMRQVQVQPGDLIGGPCFPVFQRHAH